MAQVGGDVEVERHRLRVEQGDNPSVFNLDFEVHEGDFLASACELPGKAHRIDNHLEQAPVVIVDSWVRIMDPDAEAVVNESTEEHDEHPNDGDNLFCLEDGYEEICNGGGRQHPHCNAFDLVDNKVPKAHPVVPHNEGHCFDNRAWVHRSKPIMGCGFEEVFLDAGDAVLRVDDSVNTNCIVSEEQCIWREREFVEFFLEFPGVLEIR